jgi:hypothetical protein
MLNLFEDMKWYEKLLFILLLPFIIAYELFGSRKEKRNKKQTK